MASENDALLSRLHGAGYLKAVEGWKCGPVVETTEAEGAGTSAPVAPLVDAAPSPKPALLSSSSFLSPEASHQPRQVALSSLSQNLQRTLGEH